MVAAVESNPAMISTLKELAVEHIAALSSVGQVDEDSDLAELGLDSMSALNLLLDMEDEFDVQFPEEYLTADVFSTLATLATAILVLAAT
jgi:acyl carrier protein